MSVALGVGFAAVAALSLAVQSVTVQRSTTHQSLSDIVTVVFAVNLLVMVPVAMWQSFPEFGLTPLSVAAFAAGGLLGSLFARVALFVGIERLGASRAEPLKSTFPLVALLIAALTLGEPLTGTVLLGIVFVVAGGAAISLDTRAGQDTRQYRWLDLGFPLLAALFLGIDPVFTKVGLETGTPAVVGTTVRVLAAASGFTAYRLWRRFRTGGWTRPSATRWSVAAGLANTTYLLTYLAALAYAPVSTVTPILGASPLLVLVLAPLSGRDERLSLRLVTAVAVLVLGVALVLTG